MMKTMLATFTVAAVLTAGATSASAANLITNGSFETGVGDAGLGGFTTLGAGSTNMTGWTVASGSVDWINGYWMADDGTHSVDMNGNSVGAIEQTINTVAGRTYTLTFDMSGNPYIGSDTRTMQVSAGGASAPFTYTFTTPPNSHADMNWVEESLNFTATGPTTLITFASTSTGNCCWGPALDDVAVMVPEPMTWAMLLVGFGGLGAMARSRRGRALGAF